MSDPLAAYARRAVPRYTSYPTAPHFKEPFSAETYAGWLERLDPAEPVSLYLHVPFCKQMCWYCGCNMKLAARYAPLEDYVDALLAEIELVAERLPARFRISHLHWGGGTPTALLPDDLERVMDRVSERFDFVPDAEIAIECDPRTLTAEMTERIGLIGFTRASFGVQEFDPVVQKAINRLQPPELVARTVIGLRAAGVGGVNFDLIYGLPHQTAEALVETVGLCADMAPDRIALFGYAHVPWMAKNQRMIPEDALPDGPARAAQASAAARALTEAGYEAIGLDHFALPHDDLAVAAREGRLRRNFQGYTTDVATTMISLGATSIGRTPDGYVQNLSETGAWSRAVRSGLLPVAKGLALDGEDRLRGRVIEKIMCDGVADLDAIGRGFAAPPGWWDAERATLDAMAGDGLLVRKGARIVLTREGRSLSRVVASTFDAYLGRSEARHSVAV